MHNTGNPLGSKDILDLYDNSENIDYFANSQLDEHPDRFGTKRLTLAGLIKRSMALRNEINDFSGALTFKPEWTDVPMNVSEGVGGAGGALNLQAEALGNRSEINKITSREALRRTYLEAGYTLVTGSFEAGGTLVRANDVLLQERTGKAFSGPAGAVAAGTDPASGGFVDRSGWFGATYAMIRSYGGSSTVIYCLGRTNVFDGASGYFYLDINDTTSPDDGGTVLVDSVGRRWKRQLASYVNVMWFGNVGSGVNGTHALLAAMSTGRNVLIPDGITVESDDVHMSHHGQKIYSDGMGTLKPRPGSTCFLGVGTVLSVERCSIINITIDGNGVTCADGLKLGEGGNYAAFTSLNNVTITGFLSGAGVTLSTCQELDSENIKINYCDIGIKRPATGYCTATKFRGAKSYIGKCRVAVDINGYCPDIEFDNIVTEENTEECYRVTGPYRSLVRIKSPYIESSAKDVIAAIVINGGAGAYERPKVIIDDPSFHTLYNSSKFNVSVDRGICCISNARGLLGNAGVRTTVNTILNIYMCKVDDATDPVSFYSGLLGKVSAIDVDMHGEHFLFGFSDLSNSSGTYTPVGNGVSYQTATGFYQKLGKLVTLSFSITFPVTSDTNPAQLKNLPFLPHATLGSGGLAIGYTNVDSGIISGVLCYGSGVNQNSAEFRGSGGAVLTNGQLSGKQIRGVISYIVP